LNTYPLDHGNFAHLDGRDEVDVIHRGGDDLPVREAHSGDGAADVHPVEDRAPERAPRLFVSFGNSSSVISVYDSATVAVSSMPSVRRRVT